MGYQCTSLEVIALWQLSGWWLRIMKNLNFEFYLSPVMPSLGFSCSVLSVQLPPGSALSHPFSSCECCSSCFHTGMTGNSSYLCCSSSHQVHWDPAGPVLKTELWGRKHRLVLVYFLRVLIWEQTGSCLLLSRVIFSCNCTLGINYELNICRM